MAASNEPDASVASLEGPLRSSTGGAQVTPGERSAAEPAAPDAAVEVEAAPPVLCEVEITGHVRLPAGLRLDPDAPAPMTFVAVGDCLAPTAKIIGYSGTTKGRYFVEVFAAWGSDLSICAAWQPVPGAPSTLYGKARRVMHAARSGEVEFKDVMIDLAPGAPKVFQK